MHKVKKILPDKEFIFYSAYVIWFSGSMLFGRSTLESFLGLSSIFWLKKICYSICAILILLVFCLSDFTEKPDKRDFAQYIFIGILVGIFGISWLKSGSGTYFMELMFLLAAKDIDLEKLPRTALIAQCIIIPLIICLALTGVIENVSFMYQRMDYGLVYRQALGLRHPNALGAQAVQFCICWLWIRWKKWKWYDYFVYGMCACFIYTICNSITSVALIILTAFLHFVFKKLIQWNHTYFAEKFMSLCILGIPAACILMSYFYQETSFWMTLIDYIVSWRFKLATWFLRDYPASFIGSRLPWDASSDIVYIDVIVRYGYLILFIIVLGMFQLMKYARAKRMYPLIISLFVYTLFGITEQCPYQLMYNFTLIYLAKVIYNEAGENDNGTKDSKKSRMKFFKAVGRNIE